jgi:hypothetical protein
MVKKYTRRSLLNIGEVGGRRFSNQEFGPAAQ